MKNLEIHEIDVSTSLPLQYADEGIRAGFPSQGTPPSTQGTAVTAKENTIEANRNGSMLLTQSESGKKVTVTLKQTGAKHLTDGNRTANLFCSENRNEVDFECNVSQNATCFSGTIPGGLEIEAINNTSTFQIDYFYLHLTDGYLYSEGSREFQAEVPNLKVTEFKHADYVLYEISFIDYVNDESEYVIDLAVWY